MLGQTTNYDERMKENTLDGEELLGGEAVVVEIDGWKSENESILEED